MTLKDPQADCKKDVRFIKLLLVKMEKVEVFTEL